MKSFVIRTPFPYFGSKRKVATQIWERLGEPKAYIEPFAGSLAVLLGRPEFPHPVAETVNDADGLLVNFWRAIQANPDAVAKHADYPISAIDLTARHKVLLTEASDLQNRLENDSEYFDVKLAGWWAWGMSSGLKFCVEGNRPTPRTERSGLGLQRIGNSDVAQYFRSLQARLRRVQIHTGDWQRLVRPRFLAQGNGMTAMFLDPPYSKCSGRTKRLYRIENFQVSKEVAKWAINHGDEPNLRIAFCGLAGEHKFPKTWEEFSWKNDGGRIGTRDRERIWFSPHCLRPGESKPPSKPTPRPTPKPGSKIESVQTKKRTDNAVAIDSIRIGTSRHRKDFGDLDALALDIRENGLLQPIGLTPEMTLVFGERRLRACRDVLGWTSIPARTVNVQSIAHGEFAENEMRKQYTPSERYAIVETLRGFEHGGDRRSDQGRNCDYDLLTTTEASGKVGLSKDDFYRVKKVVENGVPELVAEMDSGNLSISAASKLAEATPEEQKAVLAKPNNEERWTAARIDKQLRRVRRAAEITEAEAKTVVPSDVGDAIRLFNCRFQDLEATAGLAPASVQLVCTDIPFGNDFMGQLEELAEFADRVLAPGGVLVSYIGQHRLDEKLAILSKQLTFRWLGTSAWTGVGTPIHMLNGVAKSIPIVLYSKGDWIIKGRWVDTFIDSGQEKDWHPWQRPLAEVENFVHYFSKPGDLVVDPCGGGFTTAIACERTGRRCVSCDVEKASVVRGQERLTLERTSGRKPSEALPLDAIGTHVREKAPETEFPLVLPMESWPVIHEGRDPAAWAG